MFPVKVALILYCLWLFYHVCSKCISKCWLCKLCMMDEREIKAFSELPPFILKCD